MLISKTVTVRMMYKDSFDVIGFLFCLVNFEAIIVVLRSLFPNEFTQGRKNPACSYSTDI